MVNNNYLEIPDYTFVYSEINKCILAHPDKTAAFIYVEIDNFKEINTNFGYSYGNKVVAYIAEILLSMFHADNSCIFRLCSDSFLIVFHGWKSIAEVDEAAIMIIQSVLETNQIEGCFVNVYLNIGISIYPNNGQRVEELLKCSSIAVSKARYSGRNKYVFYKDHMQNSILKKSTLENHLHTALKNYEFEIHYQPQVKADSGEILGFEALLRWNNTELGDISPMEIINIAEENYLIIPIGEWVLRNACFFLKELHSMGYDNLTMSINVSVNQLLDDDFINNIFDLSYHLGLNTECLHLEITESVLRESYSIISQRLNLLREKGIKIALDDFGKGYSSLSELKDLPVDIIKIDKTFIDMITTENREKVITGMLISIIQKLGKEVIAEGVETIEQRDYLLENNCKILQGYLFGKPVSQEKVLEMLPKKTKTERSSFIKFMWKKDYEMDIPEVDKQHKYLFELGNKIANLVFSDNISDLSVEISTILGELMDYANYHFKCEEEVMEKHCFVHLGTHKKGHSYFIKTVERIAGEVKNPADRETLSKLLDFTYLWITNHILKSDMKYKILFDKGENKI
ncbi:MAG TPA: bacteriohemerythrin [Clostridiaceae bacterium]|nr:bacteriohemerythrin [Clostridiaceae bacterium]